METGLLHLHNLLRWVVLVLLLLSIFKSYTGWKSGRTFADGDRKVWLFTMISAHIMLLIGLYQWTLGRFGLFTYSNESFKAVMQNAGTRFFQVEHPVSMILAIVFITLGYGKAKKDLPDALKYRKAFFAFAVALLLIFLAVPWPFRGEAIGRPLFPGMH